jgi:hypothetical protein
MFHHLVDLTEPICMDIDAGLAAMTIFDTSGIEAYVTENNPKYVNSLIRRMKAWKTSADLCDSFDPYKAAYGAMPSSAAAQPSVKQLYINGHFCYVYKFGMITNGLGIIRDIAFYDEEFLAAHPQIEIEKKSDSPDEVKPDVFLGDAAFDTVDICATLLNDLKFNKAFIPLNSKSDSKYPECTIDDQGRPCCPKDPELPMKREGSKSHLRCKRPTMKFVCPKMKWVKVDGKYKRRTSCEDPCTDSPCGRMFYIYPEKDLRAFPGTARGTDEWDETYKVRTAGERSICQFKGSLIVAGRKTRNPVTSHADLLLAGITQLITLILADKINCRQYIRSLRPLIAS